MTIWEYDLGKRGVFYDEGNPDQIDSEHPKGYGPGWYRWEGNGFMYGPFDTEQKAATKDWPAAVQPRGE